MAVNGSILQAIGSLTANIESLTHEIERDRETRRLNDIDARIHRDAIAAAVSHLEKSTAELKNGHEVMTKRLDGVEKITTLVSSWKARSIGALWVMSTFGAVVLLAFTAFKEQVSKLIWGD